MIEIIATTWPSVYRPAAGRAEPWRAIVSRVREPQTYARKDDAPRWAASEFRDHYRDRAHFERAQAIVLDFDKATTRGQVVEAFGDFYGFAHTTWTLGRWRVALVLARPVTLHDDEFARVQRAAHYHSERRGLAPEHGQSAAHCFAMPSLGGAPYEYAELTGALVDVGAALAAFPKPAPLPSRIDRAGLYDHRLGRAAKYLETMPGAISGSGGHATTFRAAIAMVRGFALDPDDALRLLIEVHNPTCSPPWTLVELRHKIRQAEQHGRAEVGYLADARRAV